MMCQTDIQSRGGERDTVQSTEQSQTMFASFCSDHLLETWVCLFWTFRENVHQQLRGAEVQKLFILSERFKQDRDVVLNVHLCNPLNPTDSLQLTSGI